MNLRVLFLVTLVSLNLSAEESLSDLAEKMYALNRTEKIQPFMQQVKRNRQLQANAWSDLKTVLNKNIKTITQNIEASSGMLLKPVLIHEVVNYSNEQQLYFDQQIEAYGKLPYARFIKRVRLINREYENELLDSEDPSIIEKINLYRNSDLSEFCYSDKFTCNALMNDFDYESLVYDMFLHANFNLIPTLITYDGGNCGQFGPDNLSLNIEKLLDNQFVKSLNKFAKESTEQPLKLQCKISKWLKPKIKYSSNKHKVSLVMQSERRFGEEQRVIQPQPSIEEWLLRWLH